VLNIKKAEFYLEGLLHEIGLIYITNKLHHKKCFVRILFTRCKTLETHSFTTLTHSFLKFCESRIKIHMAHFLWSNLFILNSGYSTWAQSFLPCAVMRLFTIIAINTFLMDNQGAWFLKVFFTASRNLNFLKHLKIMPKFKEGTASRLTVILYYLDYLKLYI